MHRIYSACDQWEGNKTRNVDDFHCAIRFCVCGLRLPASRILKVPDLWLSGSPAVRESFGRITLNPPFDRGSSYFVGTAYD
jgi:hypothetical protein